jgi:cytochrome c5
VTVTAAIYAASLVFGTGAETPPEAKTKQKADKPTTKRKLTGAELYALNCNRCHNERYPTEFTAAQWKSIMMEMRVRANLPAEQARAILKYLQEESGTP